MANYNWQHVDQVLELGIGVSCCPKPKEETLSTVWNRIRPAIVGLLNSLQGIHIYVSNMDGRQASVVIEEMGKLSLPIDEYGHLWHMTTNGTFTITVTVDGFLPMTKVVKVLVAEFNEVNFNLPYSSGIPRAITVIILSSLILCVMLASLVVHCRQDKKKSPHRSYDGFQPLSRDERYIFEDEVDDEEDELFGDKSVGQFGLKKPPTKVYR